MTRPQALSARRPLGVSGRLTQALGAVYETVVVSWGWTRISIAMASGAFGALAMAPFGIFLTLVVSMMLAVWLLDGAASRHRFSTIWTAFITGYAFGFGYFVAGLWWLGAAFLVEADRFAWLMPLGVIGLPLGLALFHGLGFALARLMWSRGIGRVFALAFGLGCSEWLRASVLTGFPWNSYGMALGEHLWLAQSASLLGIYGLTVVAIIIAACPATLITPRGLNWTPTIGAALLFTALSAFGAWRLAGEKTEFVPDVKLRIMQPNLPQDAKFRPENRETIMQRYLSLSDRATSPQTTGVADVTHLIWPESAFPFILSRDATALAQIAALLPPGVTLITGAATMKEPLPGETRNRYRNSIQAIGDDGTPRATYDKVHLVPFGEYLPFMQVLSSLGLRQFIALPNGFEAGEHRGLFSVRGLPAASPLICYEAIFSGEVLPQTDERPNWLLNVTNDAWFGATPGPYQHFSQSRLRAIEEGLPLVRAANSGISAVVDPLGRVVASLSLNTEGVVDTGLPAAIPATVYAQYRQTGYLALMLVCLMLATIFAWRKQYKE